MAGLQLRGAPRFVERVPLVAPELSCDRLRVATLSWRRFRKRFGLYVKDRLPQKQRWQLVKDAQFLVRNATFARFKDHFKLMAQFLAGSLLSLANEICLFGELAAFIIISTERGYWRQWHKQLVGEVEFVNFIARDSGWPLWTGTQMGLLGLPNLLPKWFSMDYSSVVALDPPRPPTSPSASKGPQDQRRPRVAIVGHHTSQLLQYAGMLQQLTPLELHYAGCGYYRGICVELGSDPNSELAQGILSANKAQIQRALLEEKIPSYDLVLVLEVGLSLLLRQLSTELPVLHVVAVLMTELAADISEELRLSFQHPKTYAVATSAVLAWQLAWITGLKVPVISPLPYPQAIYDPSTLNMAANRRTLLQWRGDVLWNTIAGSSFMAWLLYLFERSKAAIDVTLMTGHLSWREVSQHHAVLFVPEDLFKIAFWDLYAAGMPIFLPDIELLSMLLCFEETSKLKMHFFDPRGRQRFNGTGRFEDLEPFDLRKHCGWKMQVWAPLADCYRFPHVQIFSSSLQLLQWLMQRDLRGISRRMRGSAVQKRRLAQQRFAWAVQQVFDVNGSWGD